jgi:hypothetical protein
MMKLIRSLTICVIAAGFALPDKSVDAATHVNPASHVRSSNARVLEVLRHAMAQSPSFRDLIATLDFLDRVVYVEEGTCHPPEFRSCLHMVRNRDSKVLVVQLATRQPTAALVAQLAHELYHAVEIAREPAVVDDASMRQLFDRIGYRSCVDANMTCWETRSARAFEDLVARQIAAHVGS